MNIMLWFVEQLSNPFFSAFISGVITFIFMYVDSKITRTEMNKKTYTKNILLVSILTGTIVYILTNTSLHPKITKIAVESAKTLSGGFPLEAEINYNTNDILLGEPSF